MATALKQRDAHALFVKVAIALLVFSVVGFGLKAILHPDRLDRYTPLVTVHAIAMVLWHLLLIYQAKLAASGMLPRHRKLGWTSPVLVALIAVSGMWISWNLAREFDNYTVLILNTALFAIFLPLYGFAIWCAMTKRVTLHRQALLIGTLALMIPALARYVEILGLQTPHAIVGQFVLTFTVALWFDRKVNGKFTRATFVMLAYYVACVLVAFASISSGAYG